MPVDECGSPPSVRPRGRDLLLPVAGPLACFLPLYLTASLAFSMGRELNLDAGRLGVVTGAYFAAGAVASIPGGWLTPRIGYTRMIQAGILLAAGSLLSIALAVRSWAGLVPAVAVAGLAQSLVEPAAGAYIGTTVDRRRQGFAFGVKLAALPLSSLLCGIAVPLVAAPLGWRAAFIAAAALMLPTVLVTPTVRPRAARPATGRAPVNVALVLLLGIGAAMAFATANSFSAFIVSSAGANGIPESTAGLLVALGGVVGVVSRIYIGVRADRARRRPLLIARNILLASAATFVVLGIGSTTTFAVAIVIAFVTIWGWSPVYQLASVSAFAPDPDRPLRIIVSVIFAGCIAGPMGFGWVVEVGSFQAAWFVSGAVTTLAAVLFTIAARVTDR
ncbi:MFS transporter [Acrocarpospora pleiomorpha]|uniref:MFS transporter n=1 Tax=Acrocarpospora pleiomorpha TaxID=90975 RepID=A0A5M3XEE2_9ACTN|nr:MFS transporter [Acrocarpospora pleiomorpha]GES17293.1 MFS transporter [Acrocarpospora pleiomorpha]